MKLRILGPLEAETDGQLLPLGPTKQRALLALLALHANRVVSRDQLLDSLWGEQPPPTAPTALHGYVSGLRKALGADRLERRSPGYVLCAAPDEVDLDSFERLVDEARRLEPPVAAECLRTALALWRGPALADLDGAPFLDDERRRLEELRLSALEERIDADLALGRHAELVAELDGLVREHPLHERLRGQLMLALYRSGRQAEALEVYRQGRAFLAEELGLEPGEALRRLERGILEHDPALGPVARRAELGAGVRARRWLPRSRRAIGIGVGVLVVAAAAAIAITLTVGSNALAARPNSVAVIDVKGNRLVDDIGVGERPVAVAYGANAVWVATPANRSVSRIDPKTRRVVDRIEVGTDVHDLAVGFGAVWVAGGADGTVTRIDAKTDEVDATRPIGRPTGSSREPVFWVATGAGAVWATSGNRLVRLDPTTAEVLRRVTLPAWPTGLAAGANRVWVVAQDEALWEFAAPGRAVVGPIGRFGLRASGLAPTVGGGFVWLIAYRGRGLIQPVEEGSLGGGPPTGLAAYPLDVAFGGGAVWAVDVRGTVLRIKPASGEVVQAIATAPTIRSSIAVGGGAAWVAIQDAA